MRPGFFLGILLAAMLGFLTACTGGPELAPSDTPAVGADTPDYLIGPGDTLQVFVWRNEDLSVSVPVRPDGKISVPLIEDLVAAGKTPTQLARDIEDRLKQFIQTPIATVIVTGFLGPLNQQVRVVGEAAEPQAIPYRERMTILDVMIEVGGLTEFAAGNKAIVVRSYTGEKQNFRVRLDDLLRDGDVTANVPVLPGDILIIPQSWF
ncbi:Polysialic acid transport protein KpsD precursor [Oceanibacterium hippocampi]|uniref:Polysialic acid transport protein KpsD n=2 Tax=Oceanibacterium hippocampi TaxID=745714 RepID=A0A1Y5TPR8_9PROT|nr:XrtA/PEP-CTERM system exopolysaccharide export protein [Oceanibacterium hippocampi]SLN69133.1 Polysialic acid transport protein KpsD precursor [Oceanibacterium hippocampi]